MSDNSFIDEDTRIVHNLKIFLICRIIVLRIAYNFHFIEIYSVYYIVYRIFILIFKYIYFKRLRMAGFMLLKLIEKESY